MNIGRKNILKIAAKKMAVIVLITASAAASFATLGDGNKKNSNKSILSNKMPTYKPSSFSLRSGYSFRGSNILNNRVSPQKYISLNTTVSIQRGKNTVLVPIKKNVIITANNTAAGGIKVNFGRR